MKKLFVCVSTLLLGASLSFAEVSPAPAHGVSAKQVAAKKHHRRHHRHHKK